MVAWSDIPQSAFCEKNRNLGKIWFGKVDENRFWVVVYI